MTHTSASLHTSGRRSGLRPRGQQRVPRRTPRRRRNRRQRSGETGERVRTRLASLQGVAFDCAGCIPRATGQSWWEARFWVARVRHESAVASSLAVLAGRERLQAGRCFSHVPFDCGQPFDGFSGRADGWGPERSGRDFIQWTRQYLCAEYTVIEHAVYFLLYSYKTVENTVLVMLRHTRPSRTS